MTEATRWTAVVLAGERPTGDPMARAAGVASKALLPVGGEPMLARPVRALLGSGVIGEVRVLAQQPEPLADVLPQGIKLERSRRTIAETLDGICTDPTTRWPILVTTADHALLDEEMIREFVASSRNVDVAVGFVERGPLLARFPDAQRTWLKFRGGAYSGANLFALTSPKAAAAIHRWRAVEEDRKKGWRVVAQLGLLLMVGAVLRLRTIHQSAQALGRKLGLRMRVVELSNPLAAVDVDKPADLALVEAILAGRA
ncbi:nucleotidyltransferase family protein [Sphingomonas arenae]|uniref:nucleotidyltransferase family protein n=1 Tax=Sphingomonas arenae TaxID=2812555 RepID=UPI001966EF70|nr:nucleotidyltransferase family protein [Sphingomonas arenae]